MEPDPNRENPAKPSAEVTTLRTEITDLVRTEVICPTLFHAQMYTERLANWKKFVTSDEMTRRDGLKIDSLQSVDVEPEAKMSSGYFAYHAQFRFAGDWQVEVQVYSVLAKAWRDISHALYEKTRVGEHNKPRPGSWDARLISVGHALHLADWETLHLIKEYKASKTTV
jgi:ppGpp synthetase/RelA/SpoT-type nucleotidyltranferase